MLPLGFCLVSLKHPWICGFQWGVQGFTGKLAKERPRAVLARGPSPHP